MSSQGYLKNKTKKNKNRNMAGKRERTISKRPFSKPNRMNRERINHHRQNIL